MAGMNLSSSTFEKKDVGIVDKTFIITVVVFLLVAATWGSMRWYIQTLNDRLAGLDATLAESSLQLRGEAVDRAAHFDTRLTLIGQQLDNGSVDTQALLNQLESLAVPNIKLTRYEYNQAEKFVEVTGETDNFKYIAQQIISLKSENLFRAITVDSIRRTDEGRIAFSFKVKF